MSDLLLMRGGGLRSLIHIPGLVACYLPYLDVVGRNVGRTTPPLWNFTFNSNKVVRDNGKTSGTCTFGASVTAGTRSIFKVWVAKAEYDYCRIETRAAYNSPGWAWFVVDLNTGEVYDEQIGTTYSFIHSRTITWDDDLSAWCITVDYTYYSTNSSGAISVYGTPDGTNSYTGDGTSGMYVYQWQHNLGTTLYPYSAPEGLPQSVVDRSGQGNHAQLGSTTGADTNDPSWGTNALVFDGTDDYVDSPVTKTDAFTWMVASKLTDNRNCTLMSTDSGMSTGRGYVLGRYNGYLVTHAYQSTPERPSPTNVTEFPLDTGVVVGMRFGASIDRMYSGSATQSIALTVSNTKWDNGVRIGASIRDQIDFLFKGDIYAVLMWNRSISDAEYMRTYNALKTLLAGQGVSLS